MAVVNKIQGQKCRCGSHQCIKRSEVKSLSRVRLFATLWTVAHQAPLSMGFSKRDYWNGLPFPSPRDLPNPGIEPRSPALQADSLPSEPSGKPKPAQTMLLATPWAPASSSLQWAGSSWLVFLSHQRPRSRSEGLLPPEVPGMETSRQKFHHPQAVRK